MRWTLLLYGVKNDGEIGLVHEVEFFIVILSVAKDLKLAELDYITPDASLRSSMTNRFISVSSVLINNNAKAALLLQFGKAAIIKIVQLAPRAWLPVVGF